MTPAADVIHYLAPGRGRGHTTRAIALCRRLTQPVTIYSTTKQTELLEWSGVPYALLNDHPEMSKLARAIRNRHRPAARDDPIVADMPWAPEIDANVWVWRLGYGTGLYGSKPVLRTEGPDSLWPIVMLDDDEILTREQARDDLGLNPAATVRALIPNDLQFRRDRVRRPHDLVFERFPALKWMRAFDQVLGSPGQLYNEAAAAGVPGVWLAPYDGSSTWDRCHQVDPPFTLNAGRVAAAQIEAWLS